MWSLPAFEKMSRPEIIVEKVSFWSSYLTPALMDPNLSNNAATAVTDVVALRIPNIFTPNGDGMNDFFEIVGLELFPENELYIFNRWGAELYRQKNYHNDWNGQPH